MKRDEHRVPDASALSGWHKSSYSGGSSGSCVEVTPTALPTHIPVRDSKNPTGPALVFPAPAWRAFVDAIGEHGRH